MAAPDGRLSCFSLAPSHAQPDAEPVRLLLLLVAACSPAEALPGFDAEPEQPDSGPVVWVEDGSYSLDWDDEPPATFEACDSMSILGTEVEFLGQGCQLRVEHRWRHNCLCTDDWCFCPHVGSLYAEIDGVPLRAIPD